MSSLLLQLCQTTTHGLDQALGIPHLFLSAGPPPPLGPLQVESSQQRATVLQLVSHHNQQRGDRCRLDQFEIGFFSFPPGPLRKRLALATSFDQIEHPLPKLCANAPPAAAPRAAKG